MANGLIGTFEGRLILITIWAILGLFGAIALTLLVMVRKGLPLTTQVDQRTGVKDHGVFRWFGVLFLVFVGPPIIVAAVTTVSEVIRTVPVWVWPVGFAVALSGVVVFVAVRRSRQRWEPPVVAPEPVLEPPQTPVLGWSLKRDAPQWDR
jgi:hypothetical protein